MVNLLHESRGGEHMLVIWIVFLFIHWSVWKLGNYAVSSRSSYLWVSGTRRTQCFCLYWISINDERRHINLIFILCSIFILFMDQIDLGWWLLFSSYSFRDCFYWFCNFFNYLNLFDYLNWPLYDHLYFLDDLDFFDDLFYYLDWFFYFLDYLDLSDNLYWFFNLFDNFYLFNNLNRFLYFFDDLDLFDNYLLSLFCLFDWYWVVVFPFSRYMSSLSFYE